MIIDNCKRAALKRSANAMKRHIRLVMTTCLAMTACFVFTSSVKAQRNEVLSPNIASLQVTADDNWLQMPIMQLGSGSVMNIAFDDLTHEYHRYAYKLEHCEADWTVSDQLFASDYCKGFADGNTIDDMEESINTSVQYTHYRLQIPNDRCVPTISGNYRLTVYDDNTQDTVFKACFMIVEQQTAVALGVTTNTDIDINRSHQQVSMKLGYGAIAVRDQQKEIKTVVLQNGSWTNAVCNATPQYVKNDGLQWEHNRSLIFEAGNEYRKFETLDPSHPTMGIESVSWDSTRYHAFIWPDEPRPNYIYDEDANGCFYIRNSDNIENDIASDYVLTHFTLVLDRQPGDIYVSGKWTNESTDDLYRMTYDELQKRYEATILLKQGYYSYRYLIQRSDGSLSLLPSEGNFYQTENTYQALIYYRPIGSRTDRLVGYAEVGI